MALKGTLTSIFICLKSKSEELIVETLTSCTFVCGRIVKDINKMRDGGLQPTPTLKMCDG